MDAKAKVVAYRYVDQNGYLRVSLDRNWHGTEVTPLIPLTDHEAALEERDATIREQCSQLSALEMCAADLQATHDSLLTGLEALAGEWERDAHNDPRFDRCLEGCAEELRALASSATGEKNTEEETK